jgi:3-hydroxyisobutyrate dehydrogenase-like beta-hydroxyacid dehydrogenase
MDRVGIIGLGKMGMPIARNLAEGVSRSSATAAADHPS